ncbi:methyltransferase domain-containing protein [Billgrantia saliphila]|uniref:methyltransferase domain-containing protein n=1 Tax=Billgrantia saliphila TaxID=1848458 RepID=UPI000CE4B547|nr:methyltransferase domain-containing protein [Halomonas saliphila]
MIHSPAGSIAPATWQHIEWRRHVARAFSRSAHRYTRLARAQQAMGAALWSQLPPRADRVLDLGCGPGHWSRRLADRFGAKCQVVGLDVSLGMLESAAATHSDIRWLCGDAASLPLADSAVSLVFSNLALQWCPDLDAALAEVYRVLRPGGRALINTLGPGTLREVAHAWDAPTALLDFRSRQQHLASARRAGFARAYCEIATERFHYPDLAAVMASIKGVGAQTPRPAAHLTRTDLARAERRYETLRTSAGLPVSYFRLTLRLDKES